MRFGFAVKVLGDPDLRSNDARRWQSEPHLRVSLGYLREILHYLDSRDIRMYRMSSDLAPYVTHPDMPQFHSQIDECLDELAEIGELVRKYRIRMSFHPSQYIVLNSPDDKVAFLACEDFLAQARILDAMGLGSEAVVVTHVGGVYGDKPGSRNRFIEKYHSLPDVARKRLVLENDETSYSVKDVLDINKATGMPVVFDYLHHMNNNPDHMEICEAVERSLATWAPGVIPKIHFSTPRTESRESESKDRSTGTSRIVSQPPLLSQHSEYINPFEFSMFMRELKDLPGFDIMIEAKAKNLALLRLREQLKMVDWMFSQRERLSSL